MKKLGKKIHTQDITLAAYSSCSCSSACRNYCGFPGNYTDGFDGQYYAAN